MFVVAADRCCSPHVPRPPRHRTRHFARRWRSCAKPASRTRKRHRRAPGRRRPCRAHAGARRASRRSSVLPAGGRQPIFIVEIGRRRCRRRLRAGGSGLLERRRHRARGRARPGSAPTTACDGCCGRPSRASPWRARTPAVRLDAVKEMLRSLDDASIALLRQRTGVETDAQRQGRDRNRPRAGRPRRRRSRGAARGGRDAVAPPEARSAQPAGRAARAVRRTAASSSATPAVRRAAAERGRAASISARRSTRASRRCSSASASDRCSCWWPSGWRLRSA